LGLRTLLFIGLFLLCTVGALGVPLLGLLGYMAHYIIGPEGQWWAAPLRPLEIRYSLTLAVMAAVGIALNFKKLRYGPSFLNPYEKTLLAFLGLMWLLRAVSEPTVYYTTVDHPSLKLTKVTIFCLMLTHVVTGGKSLKTLIWTLVLSTFILGIEAYSAPRWSFERGRLEGIGGVDFSESNFLPAFIGGVLPLMGILFLQSRWPGKLVTLAAGVFSVNAIVLTRSRGAIVGIALGGLASLVFAPKGYRSKIFAGLLVAGVGGLYLSDAAFLSRIATIDSSDTNRDKSAQSRLDIWYLSLRMLSDHPFGVGPGNFAQFAGRYNILYQDRDAHNTYVRCSAELGIPGLLLFLALIVHAIAASKRTIKKAYDLPPEYRAQILMPGFGCAVGLCMALGCGLTVTLLYTEALWWFLLMPLCVERAADNLAEDLATASQGFLEEQEHVFWQAEEASA
jgi:putative inorganic carbon (hco3(-)) transporter